MDIFPCEIWVEVAKYLTAFDLINFCRAADQFLYLLRDKNVVIKFDLGGCFDSNKENLYKEIYDMVGYEYIKSLNINKLYWMGLEEIRQLIELLPRLEELRALDTIVGMRSDDVILYKKLKKLAISVEADQFTSSRETYRECLSNLRSFCVKFVTKYRADFRRIYYMFFNELRKLDDLWIYDADDMELQPLRYDYIVCNLRNLKKLVIKSKTNLTLLDYQPFDLVKIYERRRTNTTTICYVKLGALQRNMRKQSLSDVFESTTEKSWNVVQSFITEIPCTFQTSIDIYKSRTIKNLEFHELSFYHTRICNATFINSVINILLSKRCRSLKKLCLTFCVLQGNIEIRLINRLIYRKFKVLEENVEQKEKQNVFRHVINNCRYLTDLEIVSCLNSDFVDPDTDVPFKVSCYSSAIIGAYDLISNLKHLRKLSLEIPPYLNATFLKDVFLKCPDLQTLKLTSLDNNEDLNSVLYSHLNYAQQLKEFRLENVHVDLDRLFSALNKVLTTKLQRVVIKCDYEHGTNLWPLEKLLKRNDEIILLVILVTKYNRNQVTKLQELLNHHVTRPAKIFVAKTHLEPGDDLIIPEAHKDMLYFDSDVSMLHFSDF